MRNIFPISPLSPSLQEALKTSKSWTLSCPVPLSRLRVIQVSYVDFSGAVHQDGEIMVLDAVASHVAAIFEQLYARKFPLATVRSISAYQGQDTLSMAANNTTCFQQREITGGGPLSMHSYGLAIDINPVQNPYITFSEDGKTIREILPQSGAEYVQRTPLRSGMVEPLVSLFAYHGFPVWGGNWHTPKDWQHFQPHRAVATLLSSVSADHARALFEFYVQVPTLFATATPQETQEFLEYYHQNPKRLMALLDASASPLRTISMAEGLAWLATYFTS